MKISGTTDCTDFGLLYASDYFVEFDSAGKIPSLNYPTPNEPDKQRKKSTASEENRNDRKDNKQFLISSDVFRRGYCPNPSWSEDNQKPDNC